jgi:hypothetical protein
MSIKEKPPDDFFKGIKLSLKSVLKHPDINLPKITNAVTINTLLLRVQIDSRSHQVLLLELPSSS